MSRISYRDIIIFALSTFRHWSLLEFTTTKRKSRSGRDLVKLFIQFPAKTVYIDETKRKREFVGRYNRSSSCAGKKNAGTPTVYQPYLFFSSLFSLPPRFSTQRRKTKSGKLRQNASNTKQGSKSLRFEGCCRCGDARRAGE